MRNDGAGAREPTWTDAPCWGPDDGGEEREVYDGVAALLDASRRRGGWWLPSDLEKIRRRPFDLGARRAWNCLLFKRAQVTRGLGRAISDEAGFFFGALVGRRRDQSTWFFPEHSDRPIQSFREQLAELLPPPRVQAGRPASGGAPRIVEVEGVNYVDVGRHTRSIAPAPAADDLRDERARRRALERLVAELPEQLLEDALARAEGEVPPAKPGPLGAHRRALVVADHRNRILEGEHGPRLRELVLEELARA